MYNPTRYQSLDTNEAFELMDQNPFATLITVVGSNPIVSHLPLTPLKNGNQIQILGHINRANPHWKALSQYPSTVIFHGAHTYVTPKWYAQNGVPTWNYSVVHVTGTAELMEHPEEITECLKELTKHAERHWPSGWDFFIPEDLTGESLSKAIVGFKISVTDIQYKKKLSQNRLSADRAGVMKGLETRTDDNSRGVLINMKKLYTT